MSEFYVMTHRGSTATLKKKKVFTINFWNLLLTVYDNFLQELCTYNAV